MVVTSGRHFRQVVGGQGARAARQLLLLQECLRGGGREGGEGREEGGCGEGGTQLDEEGEQQIFTYISDIISTGSENFRGKWKIFIGVPPEKAQF